MAEPVLIIGIDPGVNTGLAAWNVSRQQFDLLTTTTITKAMLQILSWKEQGLIKRLYLEDARLRTWFGNSGREKLKGAGSVSRDCKIWEDFCDEHGIYYRMVHPRQIKELDSPRFRLYTGYTGRTSQHARDAGIMVYKRTY